jgi:hypothetical protein
MHANNVRVVALDQIEKVRCRQFFFLLPLWEKVDR